MKIINVKNLATKAKLSKYSKSDAKNITDLCKEMAESGYSDIKISTPSNKFAQIQGYKNGTRMLLDLDFAKRTQIQKESGKSFIFTIVAPIEEWIRTITGTFDGVMKNAKTIRKRFTKNGILTETNTEYQNFLSGNNYRKVEYPNGKKIFYKKIDGDYVELFPKKS